MNDAASASFRNTHRCGLLSAGTALVSASLFCSASGARSFAILPLSRPNAELVFPAYLLKQFHPLSLLDSQLRFRRPSTKPSQSLDQAKLNRRWWASQITEIRGWLQTRLQVRGCRDGLLPALAGYSLPEWRRALCLLPLRWTPFPAGRVITVRHAAAAVECITREVIADLIGRGSHIRAVRVASEIDTHIGASHFSASVFKPARKILIIEKSHCLKETSRVLSTCGRFLPSARNQMNI